MLLVLKSMCVQLSGSPLGHRALRMAGKLVLLGRSPSKPENPVTVNVACDPPSYDLADTITEPGRYPSPSKARTRFRSTAYPVLDEVTETWGLETSPRRHTGKDATLMRGQAERQEGSRTQSWNVAIPDEPGWVPAT